MAGRSQLKHTRHTLETKQQQKKKTIEISPAIREFLDAANVRYAVEFNRCLTYVWYTVARGVHLPVGWLQPYLTGQNADELLWAATEHVDTTRVGAYHDELRRYRETGVLKHAPTTQS